MRSTLLTNGVSRTVHCYKHDVVGRSLPVPTCPRQPLGTTMPRPAPMSLTTSDAMNGGGSCLAVLLGLACFTSHQLLRVLGATPAVHFSGMKPSTRQSEADPCAGGARGEGMGGVVTNEFYDSNPKSPKRKTTASEGYIFIPNPVSQLRVAGMSGLFQSRREELHAVGCIQCIWGNMYVFRLNK